MADVGPSSYDGFLSYSHAADDLLAPRLQAGLQRFAKPWWKRRALHIFRDEASLSANPHLWSSITDALDDSEWFVLLLSPEAAESEWVSRELDYWREHKDPHKILPVVTDGEFGWSDGDVAGDAVPESLRGVFKDEPRWVDLRFARTESQLNLRHGRFRDAVADIAATVRGVPKDELESEEIRQHRRTLRTAWTAGIAILALGVAATVGAIVAYNAQQNAEAERDRASVLAEQEAAARTEAEQQTVIAEQEAERAEEEAARADAEAERATESADEATQAALENQARFLASAALLSLDLDPERSILLALQGTRVAASAEDQLLGEPVTALHQALAASRIVSRFAGGEFVALSPDGSLLATGHPEGTAIWNANTGEQVKLMPAPTGRESSRAAFSPDGRLLAISYGFAYGDMREPGPLVELRDLTSGEVIDEFDAPDLQNAWTVAFSPDGSVLVVDAWSETHNPVVVIEVSSTVERYRIEADEGSFAYGPSISPDGSRLAVATATGVDVYEMESGRAVTSMEVPSGWDLSDTAISPDGSRIAAVSQFPPGLSIWNLETGEAVLVTEVEDVSSETVVWHPSGEAVAISGNSGIPLILDAHTGEVLMRLMGHDTWVFSLAFSPSGEHLVGAGAGYDWTTLIWDVASTAAHEVDAIDTPYSQLDWLSYSTDGESVLVVSNEAGTASTIARIDATTGEILATIEDQTSDFPFTPHLAPHAGMVASLHVDGSAALHDANSFEEMTTVPAGRFVLAVSPDGSRAFLNDLTGRPAVIAEVGSWEVLTTLDHDVYRWAYFSPDGELVSCFGGVATGWLIEASTGTIVATFIPPEIPGAFSPDGELLSSQSFYGDLTMLDLAALTSGRSFEESTLWRIKAHDGGIPLAPFSSDGLLIASIGMEGRTKAWNTQDGTLVADLPTPVFANGNWHPNGTHVMVDHQGTIQVLTIDTTELIDIARSRITRGFTADECATYHIDPCPDLEKIRGG